MGAGSYSYDYVDKITRSAKASGFTDSFVYDAKVKSGAVEAKIHDSLDPSKMVNGIRESRDSAEHPNSLPVAVCLDQSGSMMNVPKGVLQKMPALMGTLVKNGLDDAQVLFSAIGDFFTDQFPFQVGQFESDNKMDDNLSTVILEGNGGGNNCESYGLFLYFLARCTETDQYSKRGEKGYAFLIEDEPFPSHVTKAEIKGVFGQNIQADIPFAEIAAEAQEKWHIFIIRPAETSHGRDAKVTDKWKSLFPERVICIDSVASICETIALAVAAGEGINLDQIEEDFASTGSGVDFNKIKSALVPYTSTLTKTSKATGNLQLISESATERL